MRWSFHAWFPLLWAAGDVLAGKLSSTDTITWGDDNSRTGYSTTHNMDPSVVGSSQFGQLWKALLPGNYRGTPEQIFSQPLVYTLDDGIQYVFVATTQNNIYKLNAKTGAIVASRNLHVPFLTLDLDGCVDINPTIGVTATGVIDPSTDIWYLTAKTYVDQSDTVKGRLNGRYWYHAIDVNTLAEKDGFPQTFEGTIARNNPNRMFQGGNAHQRPALLLSGQYVYAGFASHCVQYNFTGWIMGWDKTSGALVEYFATQGGPEPNTVPGGGVWMSGGGLASDNKGSMYFATGNGYASQLSTTPVPGRQPPTALEEAAVNMKINSDGTLTVVDFFMPWEKTQLDGADKDLGTSPLELLQTDVFTCPNVKRLGVVTGKSGKTYWLNLDNLGGYQQSANKLDAVPQVTQNENSVYAGAGVYPLEGGYIYINVIQYPTHVFKFSCNANGDPVFTKVADSPQKNAYILGVGHGTTTSLNGQPGTGLVWVSDVEGSNLRVYNAVPQNGLLELIYAANVVGVTKFTRPVFGDGRVYLGTTLGALYCFGSPVNLPLSCSSPNNFGSVLINSTSAVKTIQCQANINTQVTGITLNGNANFKITGIPNLPFTVTAGYNVSFQATFNPLSPGPLSSDVLLNTTNGVTGYALTTPVSLKGVGESQDPLLAVSPNTVSFTGVITGQQEGGVTQSIIFSNQGDGPLTILGLDYSIISETGAFVQPTSTPGGPKVGPFTFKNLPTSIPGNGQATIDIVFDPSTSGNFAVYVHVRSNGGTKIFDVVGTSSTNPVALLEFQAADGSGTWIEYTHNSPPFTFGDVYEQQTKVLKMRLTNKGDSSAASLSVTVSKPPFGVPGIIGAQNQVDLGEGTILGAGQSATASLFCSVPKSQVNVDSYSGNALWTLNVGDPNFGKQFINFTCNAVAEQVGPLYANGSATYRYAGCYKENNPGRQLKTQVYGSQDNTNDKCIAACAAQQYTFAGTQYLTECWCGNNIPILKSTDADCDFACSGNANETCGGNGYFNDGAFISLFANGPGGSIPTPSGGPAVVPSVGAFKYSGCYTEATNGRALSGKTVNTNDMTIEACAGNCTTYRYFGVEYGSECYCGNTLGAGSVKTVESDCSMTCPGNVTEFCGNGNRLTLYTIDGQASSSSSGDPTTNPTPVPTPTGPIAVQSAGMFNYTGCYTEATNGRALTGPTLANNDMTVENCAAFCAAYTYMGIEYANECYCGNTIAAGAVLAASGCSMTCSGNSSEYCGGPNRLNFYTANSATPGTTTSSPTGGVTTTSTPVPTPTGPIPVQSAGNFNYTGCYTEATNGRALTGPTLANNDMTVEKCAAFCAAYTYMGIEYASECYCGNSIGAGAVLAASGCSMTCSGNSSEYCGGPNRLNFYTANSATPGTTTSSPTGGTITTSTPISTPTGPIAVQSAGNFNYTGCYTEATNGRALTGSTLANNAMTVEKCAAFCAAYTYMGIEYASECYCGNTIAAGAVLAASGCSMTCSGNSSEYCGGPNRLNFYAANSATPGTTTGAATGNPTTTSTPVSTPTGPIAVQGAGNFNYTGCYTEATNGRALTGSALANNAMTVEKCATFCAAYTYMGIEYASECYCGNTIGAGAVLAASGCSMTCSGNSSEYCGGPNRLNFYTASSATLGTATGSTISVSTTTASTTSVVSAPTGPIIVLGDANFTYLGCYVEPANSRALSTLILDKPQMTVEICLSACSQYTYAGLEYSSECWCGMTLAPSATKATAESQCGMTCAGNSSEICGAGNRLTLYSRSPQISSSASSGISVSGTSSTSQSSSATASSSSSSASGSLSSNASPASSSSVTSGSSSSVVTGSSSSVSSAGVTSDSFSSSVTSGSSSSVTTGSSSSVSSAGVTSDSASSSVTSGSSSSVTTGSSSSVPSAGVTSDSASSSVASGSSSSVITGSSSSVSSAGVTSNSSSSSSTSMSPPSSPTTSPQSSSLSSSESSSSTSVPQSSSTVQTSSPSISSASSSTTVSTSATLSVPTPGQTVNSYIYLGCFNETTPRALVGAYKTDTKNNTNAACQKICTDRNYGLAATESGDTCACGNGLQSYSAPVLETFCNTTCVGNASEICGGSGDAKYLSVWNSTSSIIPPTMVKAVGAYPLQGCYNDTLDAHALNAATYTNSTGMSVEACVGYCITKNYDFAGLENGQSCYCDSTLASSVPSVATAQCNMLCTGNRREFCGAYNKLLVYQKDSSSVTADGVPLAVNQDNSAIIEANNTAPA